MAGLVDAESAPVEPTPSFEPPGLGHSESSLFATRVMVLPSDESTIAGARGYAQGPTIAPATPAPIVETRPANVGKVTARMRRAVVGAAALTTTFVIIWLYFVG
jgi:hypothetical protein